MFSKIGTSREKQINVFALLGFKHINRSTDLFMRLNIACPKSLLEEALLRLEKAVEERRR